MLNFKKTLTTLVLAGSLLSNTSHADIIISGTRIIYDENKKDVSIRLENKGTRPLLVQNWIDLGNDNADPGSIKAPFVSTPPVSRIEPKHGQSVKVMFTQTTALPKDRESVFWFNVLEVPPKADANKEENKSLLQLAFRTRIKLFYRPSGLTLSADKAHTRLTFTRDGQHYILKNDSPYHINILGLKETANSRDLAEEGTMIAPYSQFTLPAAAGLPAGNHYSLTLIDDFGAINTYPLSLN